MTDSSYALHDAIVAALKTSGALPAVVGARVYDDVPSNPTFPYVTLGDGQVLPDKADCVDGTQVFPRIDVWSRKVGFVECRQIAGAIVAALDDRDDLEVAGFRVNVLELQDVQYLRDPDGKTRHAAMTFRALLEAI